MNKIKLFRITTVPLSLQKLITGQLPFIKSKGFDPIMISAGGPEILQVMEEQDSPHLTVSMTRKITPIADLKALWKFYQLCRKHKPLIIHSHTPKAGIIGMLGGMLARVPVRLHTVAGLPLMETKGIKRKILVLVEKFTYLCATRVYPNSTVLTEYIKTNNFSKPDKLKVIGNGSSNGIDTEYFNRDKIDSNKLHILKKELKITPSDFVFIYIGRLVKDKGIHELINAFTLLSEKFNFLKLLLVGPFEHALDPLQKNTLSEIENNPAILSVGYQYDVRPYLAISQVLVFPSYREGFPNVPMQAGCFDLPAIVTDINGCNEIIIDGENGLIIPPKNAKELHDAMEKLLVNQVLYTKLSSTARSLIVERYEQTYFWNLLLQEYQEHLQKHEIIPIIQQTPA